MKLKSQYVSLLAGTACAALALSACGTDDPSEEMLNVSGTSGSSTSVTTSAPTDQMGLAQGLKEDESSDSGATQTSQNSSSGQPSSADSRADAAPNSALILTEIRMGEHAGKDRVVYEFTGEGAPGYAISYVSAPAQQGSGHAIEMPGSKYLQVMLTGQVIPTMVEGVDEVEPGLVTPQGNSGVEGVYFAGQFEGQGQSVIGLDSQRSYTAFTLENPPRLVVDIDR